MLEFSHINFFNYKKLKYFKLFLTLLLQSVLQFMVFLFLSCSDLVNMGQPLCELKLLSSSKFCYDLQCCNMVRSFQGFYTHWYAIHSILSIDKTYNTGG